MKTQQLEIKLSNKTEEDIKKARRKSTQAGEPSGVLAVPAQGRGNSSCQAPIPVAWSFSSPPLKYPLCLLPAHVQGSQGKGKEAGKLLQGSSEGCPAHPIPSMAFGFFQALDLGLERLTDSSMHQELRALSLFEECNCQPTHPNAPPPRGVSYAVEVSSCPEDRSQQYSVLKASIVQNLPILFQEAGFCCHLVVTISCYTRQEDRASESRKQLSQGCQVS